MSLLECECLCQIITNGMNCFFVGRHFVLPLIPWIEHGGRTLVVTLHYDMCYCLTVLGLMGGVMNWLLGSVVDHPFNVQK